MMMMMMMDSDVILFYINCIELLLLLLEHLVCNSHCLGSIGVIQHSIDIFLQYL